MGNGFWRDLGALVRSASLAGKVPGVRRRLAAYVTVYDQVVSPIVHSVLGDHEVSRYSGDSMCEACAKLCFVLDGYASMAGLSFWVDLAVLGGAVARVYDDIVDEFGGDDLGWRLSLLFAGEDFVPRIAEERLLCELYRELERRLGRDRGDPIYLALAKLHECQVWSRRQYDPAIPSPVLADITRAKGGLATVVLFALMRAAMSDREVVLIGELGGVLQLVDDYADAACDRRTGVATMMTRGESSFADICRRLRELKPAFRRHYGREQPLYAVVYLSLWFCFFRRWLPGWLGEWTPLASLVRHTRSKS
jgi:hypothetical protein